MVIERPFVLAMATAPLYTRYSATPTLSSAASQVRLAVVEVVFTACTLAGADGFFVSSPFSVVILTGSLGPDRLPAESTASTENVYFVPGVSPLITVDGSAETATRAPSPTLLKIR